MFCGLGGPSGDPGPPQAASSTPAAIAVTNRGTVVTLRLDIRCRRRRQRLPGIELVEGRGKGGALRRARVLERIAITLADPGLERTAAGILRLDVPGLTQCQCVLTEVGGVRTFERARVGARAGLHRPAWIVRREIVFLAADDDLLELERLTGNRGRHCELRRLRRLDDDDAIAGRVEGDAGTDDVRHERKVGILD